MTGFFDGFTEKLRPKRKNVGKSNREKIARGQRELCNHCSKPIGRGGIHYDVDHRDGDPSNNSIGNLQALCLDCHRNKTKRQTKIRVRKQREKNDPFVLTDSIFGDSKPKRKTKKDSGGFFGFMEPEKPKKKTRKRKTTTKREKKKNSFGFSGLIDYGSDTKTTIRKKKSNDDFVFKGLLDYGSSGTKSKRRKKKSDDDPFGFKGMMDY